MIKFPNGLGSVAQPATLYSGTTLEDWMDIATISDLFAQQAANRPDATALIHLDNGDANETPRQLTYSQLNDALRKTAGAFQSLGAVGGDVVGLLMPNLMEQQIIFWGVESFATAMPMNFLLQPEYLAPLMETAGARFLVAPGPDLAPDIWQKAIDVVAILGDKIEVIVQVGGTSQKGDRIRQYSDIMQDAPDVILPEPEAHDTAALFHTGGTTGAPKLVRHTHRNQLAAAYAYVSSVQLSHKDVGTNGFPMFHVAGAIAISLGTYLAGGTLINLSAGGFRNPAMISNHWAIVERYGVTMPGAVATALGAIASVPVGNHDISSIRIGITGGSLTPKILAGRFEAATEKYLHEVYGMTETASIICVEPIGGRRVLGSPGYAAPLVEIETRNLLADGTLGAPCGTDETGVLIVRGPTVTPGYVNPAHNEGLFTGDGWLITGDLASISENGRVTVQGRSKDVIIRSGHNIDPAQIEDAALAHPAVAEAAAVGAPDSYAGEMPVCFVALGAGAEATETELAEFIGKRVSERPAAPKKVYIIPAIPKTAVGKIFKPDLRCLAARDVVFAALEGQGIKDVVAQVAKNGKLQISVFAADNADLESCRPQVAKLLSGFQFDWTVNPAARE